MTSPRELVAVECARRGQDAFVRDCARLVAGDYSDVALIAALAPRSSAKYSDGAIHFDVYWFRVWGMRGLLWAYAAEGTAAAVPAVLAGLRDEHWRVREMAAKVAARHRVDDALDDLAELRGDAVPRVRAAAERALVALTTGQSATARRRPST